MHQHDVGSQKMTSSNKDLNSQDHSLLLMQMEELHDKLKIIDYETEFIDYYRLRPINRHYFILQTNPGEQFFIFSLLSAWLIQKYGLSIDLPQEYDDPNTTIASILSAARNLDIEVNFPPNKLKQGWGKFVISLLTNFCDLAIQRSQFSYRKPIAPVEVNDQQIVNEDNAELLLERVEEEMAAENFDSEDDEDLFSLVDDLNKRNFAPEKVDDILQTNITFEEWQIETERVLPSLKLTLKSDKKDWRGHIEQIKLHKTVIENSVRSVGQQLNKLTIDVSESMDKIVSREKFLNANLDFLSTEHRIVQETLWKISDRLRLLNRSISDKQQNLSKVSEETQSLKHEIEERGTIMTDGTPLVNIKKAIATLHTDVANMNVLVGITQHDMFNLKHREKLLLQQKFNSPIYA